MTLPGRDPGRRGGGRSHLDSAPHGGNFTVARRVVAGWSPCGFGLGSRRARRDGYGRLAGRESWSPGFLHRQPLALASCRGAPRRKRIANGERLRAHRRWAAIRLIRAVTASWSPRSSRLPGTAHRAVAEPVEASTPLQVPASQATSVPGGAHQGRNEQSACRRFFAAYAAMAAPTSHPALEPRGRARRARSHGDDARPLSHR